MNESRGLAVVLVVLVAVLVGLLQKGSLNAKLAAAVLFPFFLGRMLWFGILEISTNQADAKGKEVAEQ